MHFCLPDYLVITCEKHSKMETADELALHSRSLKVDLIGKKKSLTRLSSFSGHIIGHEEKFSES